MKKVKVPYITPKAAESAIKHIDELIVKVSEIPGNILSYCDASEVITFLGQYRDMITKASEEDK